MADIISAGFGGQGVLTLGLILAKTGMDSGKQVTWIPSYGSEMRGGTANCAVKIADGRVYSPYVKDIDILIAMNEPSLKKFEASVRPGGTIVINSSIVKEYKGRSDVKVVMVEATQIADELENPRGANIVMIGSAVSATGLFDKKTISDGIENFFSAKGKNNPKNAQCFERGYALAQA